MVFSLYGDISNANVDMLALQNLITEARKPGVTARDTTALLIQAAHRTGPFTTQEMTKFTAERQLGRAGVQIGRLRKTQLLGNQISASLQQGMKEVYEADIWGHEAFKIAYATLPDEEVAGKFAIADRNEMNPPLHADIVVVLPSVDIHRHINITQACIDDGVTVIHFICINDEWRAVSIDHNLYPQWVSSDEQMSDEDAAGITAWYTRLCLQRVDIGAQAGDGYAVPNQTANNGPAAFRSVMVKFFGWLINMTPFDARLRILNNIENLEERKFVEEKTGEDIARERCNQLVKARNEEALRLKREWEDKQRGVPSKRARPTANDQDEECDAMDIEDNLETRGEIDDDSMDFDDNNHDYVQAQQTPGEADSNAGCDNE